MSMAELVQTDAVPRRPKRRRGRLLPYLLSLPALLVCIAILVPFVTAAIYSLQRYRLNLPYLRGFIGVDNYIDFLSDPAFWNTLRISLVYTAVTVVAELLLGLGIALLLRRPTRFHNAVSIMLLLPLMTAPAIAALMWKLMTNPSFGILSYLVGLYCMVSVTLNIITASLFRLLDSIQQFDIVYAMTQGGPGDRLMVFQVQAYLEFFQYTNVGRSAALLMILWLITNILSNIFIKNWLRLRARAHGHA